MKRLFLFLLMLSVMLPAFGDEAKRLTVSANALVVQDVPFKIEDAKVSNPRSVRVEVLPENPRQFRITGLESGISDIQIIGGGMSQLFRVTVIANMDLLLMDLKRELDAVPEVEISKSSTRIVLKGEISSTANLELKEKVVKSYGGSVILDLTTFHPAPEVMLNLQRNLEKAGYKVIGDSVKSQEPGEISLMQVGDMLTISGSVYSPADMGRIKSVVESQHWLSSPTEKTTTGVSGKIAAYYELQVVPVMLQVDVVHVAFSKKEARSMGIDWTSFVSGGFRVVTDLSYVWNKESGQDHTQDGKAMFGAGSKETLSAWLSFYGGNGGTRARRAGFLTFKSNDTPEFRRLHNGGTLVISSDGVAGGSSQLEEYAYGLILEVKGGLTGVDTVSMDVKQELSYPGPISQYVNDAKLDLKKFATSTSFNSRLGETVALGGLKEFTRVNSDSNAIPYLRNVPGLKWLLANESDTFNDDEVLTLICVHKMGSSSQIDPVAEALNKMNDDVDAHIREKQQDDHKNDGKWYEFWRW